MSCAVTAQGGGQAGDTPAPDLAAVWNPGASSGNYTAGTLSRFSPTSPVASPGGGAPFPGRKRAHKRFWSDEERARLAELVAARTPQKRIAKLLGRTFGSIEYAINHFGLARSCRTWTARENRVVVRGVMARKSARQMMPELPGRSWGAVDKRAKEVRRKLRERGAL